VLHCKYDLVSHPHFIFKGANRLKRYVLILIGVLLGAFILAAQDDQGNPNDPRTNERANACYEDGTMTSKCDEEWEWVCGWYLIRFEYGLISREVFPSDCAILLPSDDIPPVIPPTATPVPTLLVPTIPPETTPEVTLAS
jgi:hypothetical protein